MNEKSRALCEELGIGEELLIARGLVEYPEARVLAIAEIDEDGRRFELEPEAAAAWRQLRAAAARDHVELWLVSAFRSIEYQARIIRYKLGKQQSLEQILQSSAPPGFSEHHTGRAVDINSLEPEFEHSAAFEWLKQHAERFGFHLSYPRDNAMGYRYEPWHWCYRPTSLATS
ncbi:D-alanyl-D-alanine carboxypeptidase family protein [Pseudomonas japonica]|uniref:M15 family metallopeptidase n=1 Tax=Pseudomonas TaxID=286 RepID=UPI002928EEBC|nr:D-alanyl-D-alanine carboxypeptidase family protein [Pseudomonas sp. zfem002]MDU9389243.1 D-alanyl-D-alanine carboxypeptidase family protein [Pseudomonas sp. zfem002]